MAVQRSDEPGNEHALDAARRNAAAGEIAMWWEEYDRDFARSVMRRPAIVLADTLDQLGCWDGGRREIRISARHVFEDPWHEVLATLRHEMAHQYADEVLGAADEPPHGPAFQRACAVLRADPRARARARTMGGERAPASVSPLLARLRKLLALGNSPNQNEAEGAIRKAEVLMREHRLAREDVETEAGAVGHAVVAVGETRKRHHAWEVCLSNLLAESFGVEVLWVYAYDARTNTRGRVLQLYGRRDRLALAEYVHGWISQVVVRMWPAYRVRAGLHGNRDRLRYYEGVVRGFQNTLREQRARAEAAADARTRAVMRRGDPELARFVQWLHPRVRTRRVGGRAESEAYREGLADGGKLRLRRPVGSDGGFGGHLDG